MFLHKSHTRKIFFPEIWAKMISANQIAGFFNQLYLQNISVKYCTLIFCMFIQILINLACAWKSRIFWKIFFCPKNWGNGPKIGFFEFKENLVVNFQWICSIMKIYIICFVPAQILYLGKISFLRYISTCSQPIIFK